MELFDLESYDVISKFLKIGTLLSGAQKLVRSNAEERVDLEFAMREKGLGWILRELSGD